MVFFLFSFSVFVHDNTCFLFQFCSHVGRHPVYPRNEKRVGVDVSHIESVCLHFVNEVCDACGLVEFWNTDNDFRDQEPAELLVSFLARDGFDAHVDAIEHFVVERELSQVILSFFLVQVVNVQVFRKVVNVLKCKDTCHVFPIKQTNRQTNKK